ncbi:hypothetical protein [Staphylococcus hominis]|uniref:hypothetical protein n=1 Tax=Staphylococcus hominis TaxID=1290 RepID=UPI003204F9F6
MVKIKKKVEMTLPELIEWGFKNEIKNTEFVSNFFKKKSVIFNLSGWAEFSDEYAYLPEDTFTVEVEEEITEDTQIYRLLELKDSFIFKDGGWKDLNIMKSNMYGNQSISEVKNDESKNFYMLNEDDTLTLIWKNGELVGDE